MVTYRQNWGEDRVYFHDDAGQLVAFPARWTSVFPPDPFVLVSAGRSSFCFAQLLELARMIQQLQSVSARAAQEAQPRPC